MSTPAIGIDLVEIGRIERAIERRPRLEERLFTQAEREYAAGHRRPARQLAARFAAKEAAIKALGLRAGAPLEIEVVAGQPPTLSLSGGALEAAEQAGATLSLSVSHEREHAVAVVLATFSRGS